MPPTVDNDLTPHHYTRAFQPSSQAASDVVSESLESKLRLSFGDRFTTITTQSDFGNSRIERLLKRQLTRAQADRRKRDIEVEHLHDSAKRKGRKRRHLSAAKQLMPVRRHAFEMR